ncbi:MULTISPECIES: enoyl-CoA hydratase/isomerase family protein [Pedobacter]|uniref:Enoyl-CoA hydratase/isomerase n=1 Tax=Pedobacter heparinus (strain ATCC 13125 / DSM 2366 / CIP 104194 / JCM 7457 / NBRC 12017 / NCIMB 9290 / NRRL B-14731 / HIM 762-3) TaxID=485917 RepID=C6XYI4_PEDHD|nr:MULTISPECIES: enoyl-CoA hydratase-related protein [Pedobacter]ACU02451.1 Enoyl-CoA hydratase/isomerase [Pedobacter heparinus DSM 2366]MBB5440137.1 enoyl-CoA hydratase/carnithine racemase [Pedobacter sp. AK017]
MNTIKVTIKDHLSIITLDRGKSNALNREMITELSDMLHNIAGDPNIAGVIITGKENFFSAGLDLIELYNYNEAEAESFWHLFLNFTAAITAFKKPLVAAVNGHSPAGGCVIALACDYRIMAEGNYIIGLNEVPVGIIVPNSIFNLYAFWLGQANASRSLLEGKLFSPDEALQIGLVDELVNPAGILTAAERKIRKYMAMERNTWEQSKLNIRQGLIASTGADQSEALQKMLKQWWAPTTRNILKTIIDNLQKK